MHVNPTAYPKSDAGFSLLEVMITLAIVSVISLALFQSTFQLTAVTRKSVDVSEKILDRWVLRETCAEIVKGLVPGWEEHPEDVFRGQSMMFSGLTTGLAVTERDDGLKRVSVIVENSEVGGTQIRAEHDGKVHILGHFPESDLSFQYLARDGQWHPKWPPRDVPSTGFFDDALFTGMPQMPMAVRLVTGDGDVAFMGAYLNPETPPFRFDTQEGI